MIGNGNCVSRFFSQKGFKVGMNDQRNSLIFSIQFIQSKVVDIGLQIIIFPKLNFLFYLIHEDDP